MLDSRIFRARPSSFSQSLQDQSSNTKNLQILPTHLVCISWCYLKEILYQMNMKMLINLVLKSDCQSVGAYRVEKNEMASA
jgi:hypothetical protein